MKCLQSNNNGPVLSLTQAILEALKIISPSWLLGRCCKYLKDRDELSEAQRASDVFTNGRVKAVDYYILTWLFIETSIFIVYCCGIFWTSSKIACIVGILATIRIVEIGRTIINTALIDQIGSRDDREVASSVRLVVLALINYIELFLCFGIIYADKINLLCHAQSLGDAFYFSVMTQLTVGYGDLTPTGFLRILASLQAIVGLFMAIVIIARFVSSLKPLNDLSKPQQH